MNPPIPSRRSASEVCGQQQEPIDAVREADDETMVDFAICLGIKALSSGAHLAAPVGYLAVLEGLGNPSEVRAMIGNLVHWEV